MNRFPPDVYTARRKVLKERIGSGQVLLVGNQESGINFKDNWYPFRQDSTLLYYTGIDVPDVHVLLDIDADQEILFGNELTIDDIVWTGPMPSLQDMARSAGINQVLPLDQLDRYVHSETMYLPPYRAEHSILLSDLTGISIDQIEKKSSMILIHAVINQRNYKDDGEVAEMEQAVKYSYDMHKAVMRACRVGLTESDLVGVAAEVANQHQVAFAYPAILTKRGEVLHNHDHSGQLQSGDIVLYDGGCESQKYYAGDITRTFPVDGKWTSLQREMYEVVYKAYAKSTAALQPGVTFKSVHLLACRTLASGLKDLGFMKGDADEAVAQGAHTMFFQCGLGHMIGLDVHDMENLGETHVGYGNGMHKSTEFGLKSLRLGRTLEEGFALTVEPGIYIIPTLIELRKSEGKFLDFINYDLLEKHKDFGGIRLEDNFLITDSGAKLLAEESIAPRTAIEIEAFMRS